MPEFETTPETWNVGPFTSTSSDSATRSIEPDGFELADEMQNCSGKGVTLLSSRVSSMSAPFGGGQTENPEST